jgi:membrane protease YdiL (CAAX protease family)
VTASTVGSGAPWPHSPHDDTHKPHDDTHKPHDDTHNPPGSAAPSAPAPSGFRGLAARHPIAGMLIMLFSIAYPLLFLLALAMHEKIPGKDLIERSPFDPDELAGLTFTLLALLPSAVYVTWAADGRDGLRVLFRRVFRWRFGIGWWVFILTALPVLTSVSGLLLGDALRPLDPLTFLLSQLGQLLIQIFLVNLWEETAWAGVMQTRLERRHNVFVAALLTAVPFGFIHWPLVLLGPFSATSVVIALPSFILLGVLLRPLAGLVMRGARDSVLAFAMVHSVFNRTNNPGGIADTLLDGSGHEYGFLIALVLLATVVALLLRRRLNPAYRRQQELHPAPRGHAQDEKAIR